MYLPANGKFIDRSKIEALLKDEGSATLVR